MILVPVLLEPMYRC